MNRVVESVRRKLNFLQESHCSYYWEARQSYFIIAEVMRGLPRFLTESKVDWFLSACRQRGHHYDEAAVLVAVFFNQIYKVQELLRGLSEAFLCDLTMHLVLADGNRWSCLKTLVSHSHHPAKKLLLCLAEKRLRNAEGLAVFQMLLDRCSQSDRDLLRLALWSVMCTGSVKQFKMFIYHEKQVVRDTVIPFRIPLIQHMCRALRHTDLFARQGFINLFCAAYEAGLFSGPVPHTTKESGLDLCMRTVTGTAAEKLHPDIFRLLCASGAASNNELFELTRCPTLTRRLCLYQPDVTATAKNSLEVIQDTRQAVLTAARQPRDLRSLCLAQLSRMVGSGRDRHVALQRLTALGMAGGVRNMLQGVGLRSLLQKLGHQ